MEKLQAPHRREIAHLLAGGTTRTALAAPHLAPTIRADDVSVRPTTRRNFHALW
ncbi:MAG: hypothetical protein HY016_03115 [Nitrosomonadales bacterium]|nr:hypothetical protein [Nitrosomonadales bacterium]